jgi:hypothetical protein
MEHEALVILALLRDVVYIRGTCIIKKRSRINVVVNNTAVGTSLSKNSYGHEKATHHLVPRMTCRICAT